MLTSYVLALPLQFQLPTNSTAEAAEDGPSAYAHANVRDLAGDPELWLQPDLVQDIMTTWLLNLQSEHLFLHLFFSPCNSAFQKSKTNF